MELFDEIMAVLPEIEKHLHPAFIREFTSCYYFQLFDYHFGLGTWIRNNFLQTGNRLSKLFEHSGIILPDDMSDFLIKFLFVYLHTKNIQAKKG